MKIATIGVYLRNPESCKFNHIGEQSEISLVLPNGEQVDIDFYDGTLRLYVKGVPASISLSGRISSVGICPT